MVKDLEVWIDREELKDLCGVMEQRLIERFNKVVGSARVEEFRFCWLMLSSCSL